MQYMRWETIKAKAITELCAQLETSGWPADKSFMALLPAVEMRVAPRKLLDEWTGEAIKIIENWDIRLVGKLVGLFPSCVPKKFHGLPIRCEMSDNENCDWIVCFGRVL
jgi:hypothetical protein